MPSLILLWSLGSLEATPETEDCKQRAYYEVLSGDTLERKRGGQGWTKKKLICAAITVEASDINTGISDTGAGSLYTASGSHWPRAAF